MKDAPREAINAFAFKVFESVVMRTPIDTGTCRQSWLVTLNNQTDEFDPSKKGRGGQVLTDGGRVIDSAKGDDTIYLQNNAP
jgi:hypothetical protein